MAQFTRFESIHGSEVQVRIADYTSDGRPLFEVDLEGCLFEAAELEALGFMLGAPRRSAQTHAQDLLSALETWTWDRSTPPLCVADGTWAHGTPGSEYESPRATNTW